MPIHARELVRKQLSKSLATAKGHLKQDRQNIRSTKISIATAPLVLPSQHAPLARSHQVFFETIELTGKLSTDQTGRFPVTSSRGSKYLMVLYYHDSNTIIPEPMKSQGEAELIRAYSVLHSKITNWGLRPKFQIIDNKCPAGLKDYMRREGITFQLVSPHLNRTNSSEQAIQTFKDHLIAGITSCDTEFPLHLWDCLLSQFTLTLNLL